MSVSPLFTTWEKNHIVVQKWMLIISEENCLTNTNDLKQFVGINLMENPALRASIENITAPLVMSQ